MKSPHFICIVLLAALALTGCATPFRAPSDAAHIKLERVDSPVVVVEKIWLERKNGPLAVTGYVIRRLSADDTTKTHLDVTLYDTAGRVLRSTVEHFEPRQINDRFRRHGDARYRVELGLPPGDISRIEVRAHEGEHPNHS
ncbi:MAG TPA: hypothetical protein VG734_04335 [Lacunisphaera sp.]|nr:hypothetical protein [Lacunisphaera sp.]